ncbi:MAG: hypothetical protein IPG45_37770 [Deltaproteobacteria bacterium]|nr:hypothetical protein [Deltaproteobacteria bacterium]
MNQAEVRPDRDRTDHQDPEPELDAPEATGAIAEEAPSRWTERTPESIFTTSTPFKASPTTREAPEVPASLSTPLQADLQSRPLEQQANAAREPEAQVASQMRRLLAEVDRAVESRPHLQPLRLRFENEDGTPMRLLVSPGPGGQHKITVVVANPQLRDELKRALPELSSAVSELPLDVSEIDITVDEVGPPRRSFNHPSRPNLGGPG